MSWSALNQRPADYQIRNSNSFALAAQDQTAPGANVAFQTVAPDTLRLFDDAMDRAFESDLVVLSGGVSAGKYDLVERVLAEFDAEFFFTRVRIQPGQPAVFGQSTREILLRSSRESCIDHGDVRTVRSSRDRVARGRS